LFLAQALQHSELGRLHGEKTSSAASNTPSGTSTPIARAILRLTTKVTHYLYSRRDNPTEALQAKLLTKDEARRIADNIARLPEVLGKEDTPMVPATAELAPKRFRDF
jgi:hypothetical protein